MFVGNRYLPNNTKTVRKNWNILQISENSIEIFKNEPIIVFKQNKNVEEVGTHWTENRRVKKDLKTLKKVSSHHAVQKLEIFVANK